jgi:hypothetical protein
MAIQELKERMFANLFEIDAGIQFEEVIIFLLIDFSWSFLKEEGIRLALCKLSKFKKDLRAIIDLPTD